MNIKKILVVGAIILMAAYTSALLNIEIGREALNLLPVTGNVVIYPFNITVNHISASNLTVGGDINLTAGNVTITETNRYCLVSNCSHSIYFNGTHTIIT